MTLHRAALILSMTLTFSGTALSAPSINDMQSCQGLLDFVDQKLASAPAKYPADQVTAIRTGLSDYNHYIQTDIVSPGLLAFNGGDTAKAAAMQTQVDAYKATIVNGLTARYPANRLYTDQAIAINNCAKKAVPSGQALDNLKVALNTMVALAKLE